MVYKISNLKTKEKKEEKSYSVWVGDGEVNDYYLTKNEARILAQEYKDDGYDDVFIRKEK